MHNQKPTLPSPVTVAALYRFTRFNDCGRICGQLELVCRQAGVRGTVLVAPEGINGTIAGPRVGIDRVLEHVRNLPDCANIELKLSTATEMPFHRLKVRIKREIVTLGVPGIDPTISAGTYVEPEAWNALISDPDTIIIDARNDYEVAIGSFADAINPRTASFSDFPAWFRGAREEVLGRSRQPKVAMFCTGGIRCEKSTAFLKQEGVLDVHHLKGGILNYLQNVPEEVSLWQGECFVFDERVSVRHGLAPGTYELCRACRRPLGKEDLASPLFEAGASCASCYPLRTEEQRAAYRERHRQQALAVEQGRSHVGATLTEGDIDRIC